MKLGSGITFLFLAALLISLSAPAQAATAAGASESKGNQAYGPTTQSFFGAVVSVDAKSGKLTIKTSDDGQKEFSVNSYTALTLGSTDAKLSDLKPGQQIIVTAQGNTAVSVALSTISWEKSSGDNSQYRSELGAANSLEAMEPDFPLTPIGQAEKVSGNVVSVDPPADLITMKTAQGIRLFVTDPGTKYHLAGGAGMLADLKGGQPVTITAQGMEALAVNANSSTRK